MTGSPLVHAPLFHLGPVPISGQVMTSWILLVLLAAGAWWLRRHLSDERPGLVQSAAELALESIEAQIRDVVQREPGPFLPLIATLALFLATANTLAILPGAEPPTAGLETDAALALLVFFAAHWFGIRHQGLGGYLASFARPAWVMLPLNIIAEVTRTFSLMVRLFGNMMAGVFVIAIALSLAGLFVPIPLLALHLLTGLVQAYIFTSLALVFIASAVSPEKG